MFSIRDIAISIGIVILIPLALIYGLSIFMKRPIRDYSLDTTYSDLNKKLRILQKEGLEEIQKMKERFERDKNEFEKELETKQQELERKVSAEEIEVVQKQLEQVKKMDEDKGAQYEKAMKRYDFNYMVISLIIGIMAFFIGMTLVESLGSGMTFGGIICIIQGLGDYWRYFDSITQFLILFGSLLLLFFMGYCHFFRIRKFTTLKDTF